MRLIATALDYSEQLNIVLTHELYDVQYRAAAADPLCGTTVGWHVSTPAPCHASVRL